MILVVVGLTYLPMLALGPIAGAPAAVTKKPASLFDPAIVRGAALVRLPEARPAPRRAQPGDVPRRGRERRRDDPLRQGLRRLVHPGERLRGLIAAWLWITVLFANFAEAMAEGRGKAQAATLRTTRAETLARKRLGRRLDRRGAERAARRRRRRRRRGRDLIPADGDVVEGIATVDESAITGESAPVIRESGGDRSAVTGGTRVLSDQIVVLVTANRASRSSTA